MLLKEGIARLEQYGYSTDEAGFVALAALHSGYFLRRQFNQYLGQARGANAQRFVEKLTARRHALRERCQANQFVYHVRGKGIYSRLGQVDNRHRREKAPFTIKRKLMCLDFVLEHLDYRFLATETEKVEYFVIDRGVEIDLLPSRRYQSRSTTETTERFFVEKLPIYLDAASSPSSPVVHFAYVDEGAQSIERFATFLDQHARLFQAVGLFAVVYVAADGRWFARAESLFHRRFSVSSPSLVLSPVQRELLDYFEVRRKLEARDFHGLDTARIVRQRQEKARFAAEEHEQMYRRWCDGGVEALFPGLREPTRVRFRTHLLAHGYAMLGGLRYAS